MKLPSDPEIEEAKRSAAAAGTYADLLTWDELDAAVIVHAFTPVKWAAYVDACARNQTDAIENAAVDAIVWPSAAESTAMLDRVPALSKKVVAELCLAAGRIVADPEVVKLNASTPPAVLARAGLTVEKAAELLTQFNKPGQLSIARWPTLDVSTEGVGFSIVVKVPSKAVYNARVAVEEKACADRSGIFDARAQAARDMIVWTSEGDNPDPIFAAWPGAVSSDMFTIFEKLGGLTAKSERRRL